MARLLFLTPQLPYPPQQGTSLRNFNILQGVAPRHMMTLLSFLEGEQTAVAEDTDPLQALCAQIVTVPVPPRAAGTRLRQVLMTRQPDMAHRLASGQFNDALRQLLQENAFDIVQIEGIELAGCIEVIRSTNPEVKILFDDHNAEAELQRRNMETDLKIPARWPAAAYSWTQVGRLTRFERWACRAADWVTVVSEADRKHIEKLLDAQETAVSVIPNSLDVKLYQEAAGQAEAPPSDLIFTGKMDYRPNVDAVLWFGETVWPLILAARPAATWVIAGQKPHPRLEKLLKLDGVTLTGWVPQIQPYIQGGRVFVMPFRIGSGTRLKLIEAMAVGKAIVSTTVGAEGFPVQDGRDLVLADQPEAMAASILALLEDAEWRQGFEAEARLFAAQYDWRLVVPQFNPIYEAMLAG